MKNKIKELIEKHTTIFLDMCDIYGTASDVAKNERITMEDLEILLKLYQSQQEVAPESIGMESSKEMPTTHNTIYRVGEK